MQCLAVARRWPGNFAIRVYRFVDLATNEKLGCVTVRDGKNGVSLQDWKADSSSTDEWL